jgi:hypothetical protein
MRAIRHLGLVLMGVCAAGVMTTASAGAFTFETLEMKSLKMSAKASQVFKTAAGSVECAGLRAVAGEGILDGLQQEVTVQYEKCKVFGIAATVEPAAVLTFDADGTMDLGNTLTVLAASGCAVTIFPWARHTTVKYSQTGKEVVAEPSISGITSLGRGGPEKLCEYAEESKGTYSGASTFGLTGGGTMKWQPNPAWLSVASVGGGIGALGIPECEYAVVGEKCSLRFTNRLTRELGVRSALVYPVFGGNSWFTSMSGCKPGITTLTGGTFCTDQIELTVRARAVERYCVEVADVFNARFTECANLKV